MIPGTRNKTQGGWTPGRGIVSGWAFATGLVVAVLGLLILGGPSSFAAGDAGPNRWGGQRSQGARPAPARPAPMRPEAARPAARPNQKGSGGGQPVGMPAIMRPGVSGNPAVMRPGVNGGVNAAQRPGQQHLPEWLNQHQNMSAQQQEEGVQSSVAGSTTAGVESAADAGREAAGATAANSRAQ